MAAFFVPRKEKNALVFISPPPPDNWGCKAGAASPQDRLQPSSWRRLRNQGLLWLPFLVQKLFFVFFFLMSYLKCDQCFCISQGSLEAGASGGNGSPGVAQLPGWVSQQFWAPRGDFFPAAARRQKTFPSHRGVDSAQTLLEPPMAWCEQCPVDSRALTVKITLCYEGV